MARVAHSTPTPHQHHHSADSMKMSTEQKEVLTVLLVPMFMTLLSVSIVNVVMPSLSDSLNATDAEQQWVLAGYTLTFGIFLVPAGRAGDIFGRGRLFVAGGLLFGLAALLAGFAPNALTVNVARLLMGVGSGLLNPQIVAMIQQYFAGPLRGRAFGMFGLAVGASVAVGPVLGGTLVQLFGGDGGWRASFLVNVPIAALAVIAAFKLFPKTAWRPIKGDGQPTTTDELKARDIAKANGAPIPAGHAHRDLDPVGVILLTVATFLVILPFLQAQGAPWLWALLPAGILVAAIWVWWEHRYKARAKQPMVDLALFRDRNFTVGTLIIGIYFAAFPSIWIVIALFLQEGLGYSALESGVIGLPSAILSAVSSVVAGHYTASIGRKLVFWGLLGVQIGMVLTGVVLALVILEGISPWWMLLTLGILGIGGGAVVSPNQTFTLETVPLQHAGSAGGVLQTAQRLGTAMGLSVVTGIYFAALSIGGEGAAAISSALAIIIVIGISGTLSVYDMLRVRIPSRKKAAHEKDEVRQEEVPA